MQIFNTFAPLYRSGTGIVMTHLSLSHEGTNGRQPKLVRTFGVKWIPDVHPGSLFYFPQHYETGHFMVFCSKMEITDTGQTCGSRQEDGKVHDRLPLTIHNDKHHRQSLMLTKRSTR